MKIPLIEARKRTVQHRIAELIQQAIALGISPEKFGDMTALAWAKAREGATS